MGMTFWWFCQKKTFSFISFYWKIKESDWFCNKVKFKCKNNLIAEEIRFHWILNCWIDLSTKICVTRIIQILQYVWSLLDCVSYFLNFRPSWVKRFYDKLYIILSFNLLGTGSLTCRELEVIKLCHQYKVRSDSAWTGGWTLI